MYPLSLGEKLREVRVVHSLIALTGQDDNLCSHGNWSSACRQTGPVPVGKGSGALLLVRRQKSPRVALTNPEKLRRLNDGPLPFQHPIHDK